MPTKTRFGQILRVNSDLLARLEEARLARAAPTTLDRADDRLDEAVAGVDGALEAQPLDEAALSEAVATLIAAIADALAAVVATDEGREERYAVPLPSAPDMIDAFDETLKLPVDTATAAWQTGETGPPLVIWKYALGIHLEEARRGVRAARVGTTVYHDSPQSNEAPIIAMLAHALSLFVRLEGRWPGEPDPL